MLFFTQKSSCIAARAQLFLVTSAYLYIFDAINAFGAHTSLYPNTMKTTFREFDKYLHVPAPLQPFWGVVIVDTPRTNIPIRQPRKSQYLLIGSRAWLLLYIIENARVWARKIPQNIREKN